MDEEKYSKKVTLHCPTCGNTKFEFEEPIGSNLKSIHCPSCNKDFSKDELINENNRVIEDNIEEIKKEVVKDLKKDLKKLFKNIK